MGEWFLSAPVQYAKRLFCSAGVYTDDSTLSKSMTLMVGSTQHRNATAAATPSTSSSGGGSGKHHRGDSASARSHHSHRIAAPESGSDTSASPVNEFSNTPTYRVPTKSCGSTAASGASSRTGGHGGGGGGGIGVGANESMLMFRPDSSTESNNGDHSPVPERRSTATATGTPRHVPEQRSSVGAVRMGRLAKMPPRDGGPSMDMGRAVSNNR